MSKRSRTVELEVLPENDWILEIPREERNFKLNAMLYMSKCSMQPPPAADMSFEQRQEFTAMRELIHMAVPQMIQTQSNSSIKGKRSERALDDVLSTHFGGRCKLTDCSHAAHAGDRQLGDNILVEYKDYSGTVPTREIDKFCRDVAESNAKIGVLCSFASHFARHTDSAPSFLEVNEKVIVLLPHAGYDGEKLILTLEWALWYLGSTENQEASSDAKIAKNVLHISKGLLGDVQSGARDLSQTSDALKRGVQKLDDTRSQLISNMRARLDVMCSLLSTPSGE
jgi:hypothetical protein